MKYFKLLSLTTVVALFTLVSCQKEEKIATKNEVSETALSKISQLGFSTQNVKRIDGAYLVEGDIVLSDAELNNVADKTLLRVGSEEQYRTNYVVTGLPRRITVSISTSFSSTYVSALTEALRRYNALGLRISFSRVSSSGNIRIVKAPSGSPYLASAGFPTSSGNPYGQISVSTGAIGNQPVNTIASILAHEIGHCIGFRHTDYANRAYSCGGQAVNEGASSVGAILISGTPSGPDPNSWMLACIGSGVNRPFNSNDVTALNYIY